MFISDKVRNQTTAYAKDELISYLTKMAGLHNLARIDLELINENEDNEMAPDRYIIDITDGKGTIKGSNSRSILLGVYAYLKHLGCRFLRPGKLGEIVPKSDLKGDFKVDLTASYNHRIEVMEGAINDDIVIEILKWLPKVGYNGYFIQFVTPHTFLNRWHSHALNPYKTPEEFSFEDADEETVRIEKFAKLLGFQLWGIGHGYMFLPFGMNYGPEWRTKLSEEAKPYVAEINGVRAVRGGNINYTNLCYSDPVVKEKMADFFVNYMKQKPYVNVISISLADGINNFCECKLCKNRTVSDIYVDMLNAIDEKLTANGIDVKIKLSHYVGTRWAPIKAKLNNKERYISGIAAVRSYTESYSTEEFKGELHENIANKYWPTPDFATTLRFMNDWQRACGPFPKCIWDYHLYSSHYYDFAGYIKFSEIIAKDVKLLKDLGSDGIQNCKTQRAAMPTNLPAYTFGELLFNRELDYENVKREYFDAAFGGLSHETEEYLSCLGDLIDMKMLRVKTDVAATGGTTADKKSVWAWRNNTEAAKLFEQVPQVVDAFMEKANEYCESEENATVKRSFELLYYHGEIIKRLAKALYEGAMGNRDACDTAVEELRDYIMKNEDEYLLEFDAYLFVRRFINEVVFKPGT